MAQRSTKGASKQRRDAINEKIGQLRQLLPVSEAVRCRLSQLQVMAMTNAFITKSNFFDDYCFDIDDRSTMISEHFDFTQTLPGFLLIASVDGRILYISENVSEHLGNSAVDTVTQMESVYDIIDERDRDVLRQAMTERQQQKTSDDSKAWTQVAHGVNELDSLSFICRMNSTGRNVRGGNTMATIQTINKPCFERQKTMQVTGRFVRPRSLSYGAPVSYSKPSLTTVFVALCTPHLATFNSSMVSSYVDVTEADETDTLTFRSLHRLNMQFIKIEPNGEYHLAYDRSVMFGKSWYEMIHPEDMEDAKTKHMELIAAYEIGDMTSSKSVCVRVQTGSGRFLWLHVVMRIHSNGDDTFGQPMIVCTNHVIDEMAALYLRLQEVEMLSTSSDVMTTLVCHTDDRMYNACSVPLPVYEANDVQPTPMTSRSDHRQEVAQRLKRKICDRQQADTACDDRVQRSKRSRLDGVIDDIDVAMLSMPSPPFQQWDCNSMTTGAISAQTVFTGNMTAFDFPPTPSIPESFLTPRSSPALASSDSQLIDLGDLNDDRSFFHGDQTFSFQKTSPAGLQLPILDHHSVASVLGDSDLLTPVTPHPASTTSQFVAMTSSSTRRQQMSGGQVMVVGGTGGQPAAGQGFDAAMTSSYFGGNQTDPADQMFNEQLIGSLFALGEDFLQSLQFDAADWTNQVDDCTFQTGYNQFYPVETPLYGV